jgi:3-oxoacyl-(acyl-carrier-protein) synthase
MPQKVCITGMGIVSAIGNGVPQNLQSLLASRSGLTTSKHLDSVYRDVFVFGEIDTTTSSLMQLTNSSYDDVPSRTALLGIIAAREAVQQAGLSEEEIAQLLFFNATTVGGMCESEKRYIQAKDRQNTEPLPADWFDFDCADCTEKIADTLGIKNYMATMSTACSSSANSIMLAARHIRAGKTHIALCGGTDGLSKLALNGFNALKNMDKEPCKPFDVNRGGLNLGEAAAFLVLESEASAVSRRATILATVSGWANISEAFHQTAPSPEGAGAYQSMTKALELASLQPTDIQYINAHGTATYNNDLSEGLAIQRLFRQNIPSFSSTKPFTGHTLAAAGAVEAVFSVLSINQNAVFANLNFSTQLPELTISPQTVLQTNVTIDNVLSNSFGFGGSNSSLVFSKYV